MGISLIHDAATNYIIISAMIVTLAAASACLTALGMARTCQRKLDAAKALRQLRAISDSRLRIAHMRDFALRQNQTLISLFVKLGATVVIAVVQMDRYWSTDAFWLSTGQRSSLAHFLLAMISATAVRLWRYAEPEVQRDSDACDHIVSWMDSATPVFATMAVVWDMVDLSIQAIRGRDCVWFCSPWIMGSINLMAASVTAGGWIYVCQEKRDLLATRARRRVPTSTSVSVPTVHWNDELNADKATAVLAGVNATLTLVAFLISMSFTWAPVRPPQAQTEDFLELSDKLWYAFSALYLIYLCTDTIVHILGRVDVIPAINTADDLKTSHDIEGDTGAAAVKALEAALPPLTPTQAAVEAVRLASAPATGSAVAQPPHENGAVEIITVAPLPMPTGAVVGGARVLPAIPPPPKDVRA